MGLTPPPPKKMPVTVQQRCQCNRNSWFSVAIYLLNVLLVCMVSLGEILFLAKSDAFTSSPKITPPPRNGKMTAGCCSIRSQRGIHPQHPLGSDKKGLTRSLLLLPLCRKSCFQAWALWMERPILKPSHALENQGLLLLNYERFQYLVRVSV